MSRQAQQVIGAVIAAFTLGILTATAVDVLTPVRRQEGSVPTPSPSLSREDWLSDPYVRCLDAMDAAELAAELCIPLDDPR